MDGAEIIFWVLLAIIPVIFAFFYKGNAKVARIILCFFIVIVTTIWAIASEIYALFSLPAIFLIMGILYIVFDDETNIWKR